MDDETEYAKAYTELACLLAVLPKEFTEQIPPYAKSAIKSKYDERFVVEFNDANPPEKYNFSNKARALLAVLNYNCWADDEEKKKFLLKIENNDW